MADIYMKMPLEGSNHTFYELRYRYMCIDKTIFCINLFSRSPLKIRPFPNIRIFTYLRKYLVCGIIFEISAFP